MLNTFDYPPKKSFLYATCLTFLTLCVSIANYFLPSFFFLKQQLFSLSFFLLKLVKVTLSPLSNFGLNNFSFLQKFNEKKVTIAVSSCYSVELSASVSFIFFSSLFSYILAPVCVCPVSRPCNTSPCPSNEKGCHSVITI